MTLQAGISRKKNRSLIGREVRVLVDGEEGRCALGRLYNQAPEIDGVVRIKGGVPVAGEFLNVTVTGAGEYDLTARHVES